MVGSVLLGSLVLGYLITTCKIMCDILKKCMQPPKKSIMALYESMYHVTFQEWWTDGTMDVWDGPAHQPGSRSSVLVFPTSLPQHHTSTQSRDKLEDLTQWTSLERKLVRRPLKQWLLYDEQALYCIKGKLWISLCILLSKCTGCFWTHILVKHKY